jgi:predicted DNA-binding protein (MmcQ/YjbR family)
VKPPAVHAHLLALALDLPGAWQDTPWEGDLVTKAGKKIFVFFGHPDDPRISVKLPDSADQALGISCCTPTSYGLGRHGWVTIDLAARDCPEPGVLEDWVEESYRAVAPKKLIAELDARS